jgi:glycosyltransferase involved in cell wall biosynthesis
LTRPRILAVADYFLPGYRAGGVITGVANAIQQLQTTFDFRVLTRDRDLGATEPYPTVSASQWNDSMLGPVYYLAPSELGAFTLARVLRETPFDLLYLNSFFSRLTSQLLLLRRLGLIQRTPVVLAPRGEMAASALRKGRVKKWVYRRALRGVLFGDVVWQASSDHEADDIATAIGRRGALRCVITGEVPGVAVDFPDEHRVAKRPGHIRAIFVGRVHRVKNLDLAIELMRDVDGEIELTVVGPLEDADYWRECQAIAGSLPPGKRVSWAGVFRKEEVAAKLAQSDLLMLPSRGENCGHAIFEAFAAGCPVYTSDRTPWRDLAKRGIGWDVPLADVAGARAVLDRVARMSAPEHNAMRERAKAFARAAVPDAARRHEELFRSALAG